MKKVQKIDIISQALSEVGYIEGKNNDNAFGREYGWNNVPWCVIFIWHLFHAKNADELFFGGGKTASCSRLANFHRSQRLSKQDISAGDIVFFNFNGGYTPEHVGICVSRNGNTIYTVEGNTSGAHGEGVYKKERNLKNVVFAYRPAYADDYIRVTTTLPQIEKGWEGPSVRAVQAIVNLDVTGVFDGRTEEAIVNFQREHGLTADGIVGAKTWKALFEG